MQPLRPSLLPALAACRAFAPAPAGEAAEGGTDRHTALRLHFAGDNSMLDTLDAEDREGVLWAADYIRLHAPMSEHPLQFEVPLTIDVEFETIKGTADVICGPVLFDLKWRKRDYTDQVAAYALGIFQDSQWPTIEVHLLFAATKYAQRFTTTEEYCERRIHNIIIQPAVATPCDYCGWCALSVDCPAMVKRAQTIAAGREDWAPSTFHASQLDDPAEMAKALTLARQISKWCESVEYHAKELVLKQGKQLPGYELKPKKGRSYCTDVSQAFGLCGLPQADFLRACDLRLNTSKTQPDKVGLVDLYAKQSGMKQATAKKEILRKLEPVLKETPPTQSLVAVGNKEED